MGGSVEKCFLALKNLTNFLIALNLIPIFWWWIKVLVLSPLDALIKILKLDFPLKSENNHNISKYLFLLIHAAIFHFYFENFRKHLGKFSFSSYWVFSRKNISRFQNLINSGDIHDKMDGERQGDKSRLEIVFD